MSPAAVVVALWIGLSTVIPAGQVSPEDPRTVLVTVLNVRTAGSLGAPVQDRLALNDVVCVHGRIGAWLEVLYATFPSESPSDQVVKKGFVHRGFVSSPLTTAHPQYAAYKEICRGFFESTYGADGN